MNSKSSKFQHLSVCVTILLSSHVLQASESAITNALKSTIEKGVVVPQAEMVSASSQSVSTQSSDGGRVVQGTNMSAMILDKLKVSEQITPETTALFGETIDLNTGAMSLQNVDVAIPGNFDIPVEFRRVFKGGSYSAYTNLSLGDWSIGIPSISTTVLFDSSTSPRFSGNWGTGTMCSGPLNPRHLAVGPVDLKAPHEYWSGETLEIPGVLSEKIQANRNGRFIKNWRFSCTTTQLNGVTIEGIKATSPAGVTYAFTVPKLIPAQPLSARNGLGIDTIVPKYHAFLLVSSITDRFGNFVNYNYTDGQLTSISSSDERLINISYETNVHGKSRVSTVTANNKSWQYGYVTAQFSQGTDTLSTVTRPDGKSWQMSLDALDQVPHSATYREYYYKLVLDQGEVLDRVVETQCIDSLPDAGRNGYIIHPNGARLDLNFKFTRFGRTGVPKVINDFKGETFANDLCFMTNAVSKKTLSGPGLQPMTWHYIYSQNKGAWIGQLGQAVSGLAVKPTNFSLNDLRSTTILTPDGAKTIHIFSRLWDHTDGQEVATEYYDTNGTSLLRRIERNFDADKLIPTGGSVEMYSWTGPELGWDFFTDNPIPHENYVNKTSEIVYAYTGGVLTDTFTTEYSDFNEFGVPRVVVEKNSINPSLVRTTTTSFKQDLTNWVLNLETNRQISQSGTSYSERSASYYGETSLNKSLKMTEAAFGRTEQTFSYNDKGLLTQISFALPNRWVKFENYKRGRPTTIRLPNRYDSGEFAVYLEVNDDGSIAWAQDLNGNKTTYSYDDLGRLTLIDPFDSRWANTSISYDTDFTGVGALLQTISRGNYRKTITLDALMQPILTKEWDWQLENDSVRYTNQKFNAYGKPTFQSVPSQNSNETFGSTTSYDGLQRVIAQTNTPNGDVRFTFGANNKTTMTNGRGINTTTSYLAFGTPATDLVKTITQPYGIETSIDYNHANMPVRITQGGITEIRDYNQYMELCLQKRPETGVKIMKYNSLGQVTDYKEGLADSGNSCTNYYANIPVTAWNKIEYDNLGSQQKVKYSDDTPEVNYNFDRQGNLLKLTAGNVAWDYSYNSAHQVENEWLSLDSLRFEQNHEYNSLGHLVKDTFSVKKSTTLEIINGAVIHHIPNALGQTLSVNDGTTQFARNVKYHPNGQLHTFDYGNGLKFLQTLDDKQRPYERRVDKSIGSLLSQRYTYDNNNNVEAIHDLVQSSSTITLTYDDLDRLKTGTGAWGYGEYNYDSLGNITSRKLGSSTLNYNYNTTSNRLMSYPGKSFTYDAKGNVTGNGSRIFTFNEGQQLKSSGSNLSYVYDGYNRRVKQLLNGSNSYTVYNAAGQLVQRYSKDKLSTFTIYLGKVLLAEIDVTGPPAPNSLVTQQPSDGGSSTGPSSGSNTAPVVNLSVSETLVPSEGDAPDCQKNMMCQYELVPKYNYGWISSNATSCNGTLVRTLYGASKGTVFLSGTTGSNSVTSTGDGSLFTLSISCTGVGGTTTKTLSFGGVGSEM